MTLIQKSQSVKFWKKDLRHFIFRWLQIQHDRQYQRGWAFPGYRGMIKFLRNAIRPREDVRLQLQGFDLLIPGRDEIMTPMMLAYGVHEAAETDLIRRELHKGMTFIDIGANVGYFSLLASSIVGPQGRVFAFEPEPESYQFLRENIKLNRAENIFPIQKAVSNRNGKMKFFLDEGNWGGHTLASKNIQTQQKEEIEIDSITLDDFYKNSGGELHFIKIDAQGAEGLILEKMEHVLALQNLKILIEFWPEGLRSLGTDPLNFLEWLNSNFEIQSFNRAQSKFCLASPSSIMKEMKTEAYLNLFCKKK